MLFFKIFYKLSIKILKFEMIDKISKNITNNQERDL